MLHSVAVGFQPVTFGCGIMQTQLVKIMPGWLKPKNISYYILLKLLSCGMHHVVWPLRHLTN